MKSSATPINTDRSLNRPGIRRRQGPPRAAGHRNIRQTGCSAARPAADAGAAAPFGTAGPAGEPPRRRQKKKRPLWLPLAVVMAVIAVISGVVVYG